MPPAPKAATKIRRIVADLRKSGRTGSEFDALALIAEKLAKVADAAERAGEARLLLAALRDLRTTLDRLTSSVGSDPVTGDVESDGGGLERELADLVRSGPTMGDAADS